MTGNVRLVDLLAHRRVIGDAIDAAVSRTIADGRWIMGPAVGELEAGLAARCGASSAVTCSNCTDALKLGLLALGLGHGDAVLCPSFTFTATAEVIALLGAVPVFVDCEPPGFNLSVESTVEAIASARRAGLVPVGIISVDLFGVPAGYEALEAVAAEEGLWLLADAAQSFGATLGGRAVGTFGEVSATSFFPAKPLGCYGDGGATFTDDDGLAGKLRSLRSHGQGADKYDNVRVGMNARLDSIQAAVLVEKLTIFDGELERRRAIARTYGERLAEVVGTPQVPERCEPTWAQYTLRVPERDSFQKRLAAAGVDSAVYYPRPLHRQPAYSSGPGAGLVSLAESERAASEVLSIPVHPYLTDAEVDIVVESVTAVAADLA
ncbi:MAG: aminotransferase class I/II-fold pyridoxal phosphate-dependent enzyme [Acidimicrobiia bacterium]|nr:aminotransferase class I/II-fold pyridoxal phosphate-dependent enzyme [Acidimicrobiia bacterium]